MTTFRRMIASVASALALFSFSTIAFAQDYGLNSAAEKAGLGTKGDLSTYAGSIIGIALGLLGSVFLVLIIWGGVKYMLSQGDTDEIKKSRDIILSAVIGIVIIAAAYTIVSFVFTNLKGVGQ